MLSATSAISAFSYRQRKRCRKSLGPGFRRDERMGAGIPYSAALPARAASSAACFSRASWVAAREAPLKVSRLAPIQS